MAWTASRVANDEYREDLSVVDQKAEILANYIRESKHFIAFTGAGLSTSAGIPDFRGPDGQWTLMAQGRQRTGRVTDTLQAVPTPSHMALVELQNRGILKYVVSQNCDGLHRRSGILPTMISELHGNSNREYCRDCGKDYIRDFRAVATYEVSINDHRTERKCGQCGGALHDTIINFGELLPMKELELAFEHAAESDLCLVLGSSLMVTPACDIPKEVGLNPNASLAICNLQATPLDNLSALRVFSEADTLMIKLMGKLEIPIPPFILRRYLIIRVEATQDTRSQATIIGVDSDGTHTTFLQSASLQQYRRVAREEPFTFSMRDKLTAGTWLTFNLQFMGHYNEPNLELNHEYKGGQMEEVMYFLEYNPQNGSWHTKSQEIPQTEASTSRSGLAT